jgi:hypothetical protein
MNERGVGTTLLGGDLGARVSRGAVAGIAAGLLFLLANMAWATKSGMPGVAPLIDMATIFNVTDKPDPTPENIAIGLVTHLNLSMLFGIGFALIVPLFRDPRTMALAGAGYGIALYLVNFQILGRTVFPWFQEGPDQVFELFAHAGYGLLLVPFMVGLNARTAAVGAVSRVPRAEDSRRQFLTPAGRSS